MRPLALLAAASLAVPAGAVDGKVASERAGLSAEGAQDVAEPKAAEVHPGSTLQGRHSWPISEARRLRSTAPAFDTEKIMGKWIAISYVEEPADPKSADALGHLSAGGIELPTSMLPRELEFLRDYRDNNYLVFSADGREAQGCGTISELPRMRQVVCEEKRFPGASASIDCKMPHDGALVCEIVTRSLGNYISTVGDRARFRYFVGYTRPPAPRR